MEYLGIAADEPARFGQLNERKRAPLVEFGIDEDLCGLYCQYAGILAPTYETSCRTAAGSATIRASISCGTCGGIIQTTGRC